MIATHNIKVNNRWYRAGEEVPDAVPEIPQKEEPLLNLEAVTVGDGETAKPKSTRRKTTAK